MKLETIVVGDFAVNCYLYYSQESKSGVIIDPGADPDQIFDKIESLGIKPLAILLTHGHCDHIGAVSDVKERYKIPIYILLESGGIGYHVFISLNTFSKIQNKEKCKLFTYSCHYIVCEINTNVVFLH